MKHEIIPIMADCRVGTAHQSRFCHCERSEAISLHHSLFLVRHSIFTTTFAFLLVLFLIAAPAYAKYGGGTGGLNDPYLIFTAEQINEIGLSVNWDDWDKHFILMADIDLSAFTGTAFNIIGTDYYHPFTGVFDGNGHTISNFSYTSAGTNCIGLFGYVSGENSLIKDLGLIAPDVDAGTGYYVGSLVGYLKGGTITNCYVEDGSILGDYRIGGLVGYNWGTISDSYATGSVTGNSTVGGLVGYNDRGTITNCYSTGSVSGNERVGGLVGYNWAGTITNCYSEGDVSGYYYVGGLVGSNWEGTITNCYSNGSVSGDDRVGGLAGYNDGQFREGTITNCYSAASVEGNTTVGGLVGINSGTITNCYSTGSTSGNDRVGGLVGANGGTITNCYSEGVVSGNEQVGGLVGYGYRGTITNCYSTGYVSGHWGTGGLVGHNRGHVVSSYWDIQTSGQTTSAGGTGKTTAEMQTASTFALVGWGCGSVWTIDEGNDYPRLFWENKPGELITIPSELYGGGSGELNDPYLIYTAEQLNKIGLFTCPLGKHFKLMADIDLSAYTGTSFNIIGTTANPFTGVFDGNGHTISNFTYSSTDTNHIGLFGCVRGVIKDLGLIDPDVDAGTGYDVGSLVGYFKEGTVTACYAEGGSVSGNRQVGGLVGRNYYGTINNCYTSADVSGTGWSVGGLVGENGWGTVINCYSTGSVSGGDIVGGLVGRNYDDGTITDCYSEGDVSGYYYVGGLVGVNWAPLTITNCYSTGSVSGDEYVGGLVGGNMDGIISKCYSTGSVTGDNYVGGLVGRNLRTVYRSFWDVETSGQTTSDGGTGLPTAEMQTMSTFTVAGWDFETPVWTIDEGVDYPRLWWELAPVLHAEPEVTLGTSNIISWDPVPGANDYYAECAADANFTSIVYATGWITETSYKFTDLELGKRYWYSVKARNIAGIETGWSNVESSLQVTLADAVDMMLDPDTLKNKNLKNALLNKINTVQQMLDKGLYSAALNKLQNDILQKTDGCAETGEPDKNDWIVTCEGQGGLYPLVIETIENVRALMNQ